MVKMISDDMLAAPGDKNELFDSGLTSFLDGILDHWLVHDWQHFLRDRLGRRQKARTHARHGKNSFADKLGLGHEGGSKKSLFHAMPCLLLSRFLTLFQLASVSCRGQRMRSLGVVLAVGFGLCACGSVLGAGAADAILAEASGAIAQGQYRSALTLADGGLAESGADDLVRARLLVVRGLAHQALDANDNALSDFTQSLSIGALPVQERGRALFARGVSLDSMGHLNDALGDYGAVLKLTPNAPDALNNQANVFRRQGRLEEARRSYMAALTDRNPHLQYPYFGMGQIAEAQGDLEAAKAYYSKALAADPAFQLAIERLQALGATGMGVAPADSGAIILRPPARAAKSALESAKRTSDASGKYRGISDSLPPAERPADLRPTIVGDGAHTPLVQLGAWRSEEEARAGWKVAQDRAGALLEGLTPLIVRVEVKGRGTFFRLRLRPPGAAAQFCALLLEKKTVCVPAFR
jgi:tetratricopeptide (TPR) repeat protein